MENDELQAEEKTEYPPMHFNDEIQYLLYEAAKWAKMLAIIGFVLIGLLVLVALSIGSILTLMNKFGSTSMLGSTSPFVLTAGYILLAAIYFFPTLYLYQFASNAKEGINYNSELQLTAAFSKLKSLFKFWGVFSLIVIGFYALVIILALIGGLSAALTH